KFGWPQMHDPLCVAYAIDRSKFVAEYKRVVVDTNPVSPSYGMTSKENLDGTGGVTIPTDIDRAWFWEMMERSLRNLP
ncbi:MAG TPA: nucleoside hydrolase, partial [Sphaerochaeta sp.]|nr:nucleoside hydrolase [Sphaerochaeta sp.]